MKHICKYTFSELREMKYLNNFILFPENIRKKAWTNFKEEIEQYPYSDIFTTRHLIECDDNEDYKPEWCDLITLNRKNYIVWNVILSTLRSHLYNRFIDNAYENVSHEDILNKDVIVEKRIDHIPNMYKKYRFLVDMNFFVGVGVEIVIDYPYLTHSIIDSELTMFLDYMETVVKEGSMDSECIVIAEERINEFYNSFNTDNIRNFFAISTSIDPDYH
jgi:hypothetical protein